MTSSIIRFDDLKDTGWPDLVKKQVVATSQTAKSAQSDAEAAQKTANDAIDSASGIDEKFTVVGISIEENAENISNVQRNLQNHTQSRNVHGALGDVVGNLDYATDSVGGVVLLASALSDLQELEGSLSDAPAEYEQSYSQQQTDLILNMQSKINEVITAHNELLQSLRDAKQMQDNAPVG